jgi:hypothetical protein
LEALIPIIAILAVFGSPVVIVKEILAHRERRAKLALGQSMAAQKALPAGTVEELAQLKAERKVLLERVENLEAIVCGVDFELNQKLSKLIDEQRLLAESTIGQVSGKAPTVAASGASPPRPAVGPGAGNLERTATVGVKAPSTSAQTLGPGDVLANRYRI